MPLSQSLTVTKRQPSHFLHTSTFRIFLITVPLCGVHLVLIVVVEWCEIHVLNHLYDLHATSPISSPDPDTLHDLWLWSDGKVFAREGLERS